MISFSLELDAGEQRLQTWLSQGDGAVWGAYYLYIHAAYMPDEAIAN